MKTQWQVKSYTSSLGETGDYFTEAWIENGELKLIASSDIESDEELHEIANALNSFESLAQQNKELRDKWENDRDDCIEKLNKESAEIQRLTKEVEELKSQVNGWAHTAGTYQNELTRLRELLVRANELISDYEHRFSEFDPNKRDLLVREIDNALNHKP